MLKIDRPLNGKEATYNYRGELNPFVDALPNFRNEDEIINLFYNIPEVPEDLVSKSDLERFILIDDLDLFRVPFLSIRNLAYNIYSMILSGYRNRVLNLEWLNNPRSRKKRRHSNSCSLGTMTLMGVSGVGKSTAVEEILYDLDQVIIHSEYLDHIFLQTQIVYLIVDCPPKATLSGFLKQILSAIDTALGNTQYFESAKRQNVDTLLESVIQLLEEYKVGLLVIDEANHLVNTRQNTNELSSLITTFINLVQTPVLYIGTYHFQKLIHQDLRTARRLMKKGSFDWNRLEEDSYEWRFFVKELWSLQYTLSYTPLTEELQHTLYEVSQGILAVAVAIFARVQRRLILDITNKQEIITVKEIEATAQQDFDDLNLVIDAIRRGDEEAVRKYDDIQKHIQQANDQDQKILKSLEKEKQKAFNNKLNKLKTGQRILENKILFKLNELEIFNYLGSERLKEIINKTVEVNKSKKLKEEDLIRQILKKALAEEEIIEKRRQNEINQLKKELSNDEGDLQQILDEIAVGKELSYTNYLSFSMIGVCDEF